MEELNRENNQTTKTKFELSQIFTKIRNALRKVKNLFTVKNAIVCTVVLILMAGAYIAYSMFTNNYYTPIKLMEKYANAEEYRIENKQRDYSNGLAQKEWKKIRAILQKSDSYVDAIEEYEEEVIESYEAGLDAYGDDFVISYAEKGKSELSKSELRDYRSDLQDYVDMYEELVEETEEYDSSDWGELADEFDLTKADTRELIEQFEKLVDQMGRIEVSEGYEVELERTITGSLLEEPEIEEVTIVVLKVNGRWIAYSTFTYAFSIW